MANELPEFGAKATIDLTEWDKAAGSLLADASRIDKMLKAAFGSTGKIDIKIDDQAAKTAQRILDDLDSGVTSEVDFKMTDDNVVKGTLDKLDAGTTAEVDFKATGDTEVKQVLSDIESKLGTLQKLALIKLALDVPAAAEGFITGLTNLPGISTLIEMDTVLAQVEGRTGRMIPQAEELITELYTNAWGESVTAVGEVVTAASNLGIEMDDLREATIAAFNLEAAGFGTAEENLRTLDSMVKNNLAPDYTAASNILVAGLQNGADRGQDLLDTFDEYGGKFDEMKISGEGAMAFLISGLEAGAQNSDRVADGIHELGIRLATIHEDPAIQAAFTDLDKMTDIDLTGLLAEFEAGTISGDTFYGAFFQALEDGLTKDPTKTKNLAATLIGTMSEDFTTEAFAQLTPVWDEALWGPLEDRAQTASDTVNNTLSTALTELFRTLEAELAGSLDEMFDFDAVIDKAKQAIKDIAAALRSGEGLAEALEIGFKLPGFADQVHRIESAINNFLIGLLQAVADVGSFLGKDVSGIRGEVARVGAGQLQFDLEVATNEDEIAAAYSRAIDRGVDASTIGTRATEAALKLFDEGDIERAQTLIDILQQPEFATAGLSDIGRDFVKNTDSLTEALTELYTAQEKYSGKSGEVNEIISAAIASDIETVQAAIAQTEGLGAITGLIGVKEDVSGVQDTLTTAVDAMKPSMESLGLTVDQLSLDTTESLTAMQDTSSTAGGAIILDAQNIDWQIGETEDGFSELGDTVMGTMPTMTEQVTAFLTGIADGSEATIGFLVAIATQFQSLAASAQAISDASNSVSGGGNTPTSNAGGGTFSGWSVVGEQGPELISSDRSLNVLNARSTAGVISGLQAMLAGAGGMSVQQDNHRQQNNQFNFYPQSETQTANAMLGTVNAIRGFGT